MLLTVVLHGSGNTALRAVARESVENRRARKMMEGRAAYKSLMLGGGAVPARGGLGWGGMRRRRGSVHDGILSGEEQGSCLPTFFLCLLCIGIADQKRFKACGPSEMNHRQRCATSDPPT